MGSSLLIVPLALAALAVVVAVEVPLVPVAPAVDVVLVPVAPVVEVVLVHLVLILISNWPRLLAHYIYGKELKVIWEIVIHG